jgi:exosortase
MPEPKPAAIWRHHLPLALLLLLALLTGLALAIRVSPPGLDNALLLAALAALLAWNLAHALPKRPSPTTAADRLAAWTLVAAAFLSILIEKRFHAPFLNCLALLCLALAAAARIEGLKNTVWATPALAVALLVLPHQEYLILSFSYPLRLISTIITVSCLKIAGLDISHHLTSIYLGESEIAVTDACSGIDQLAVMLLLGYILVRQFQHTRPWQAIHYLFLVPAVILANSLRLITSCLLYLRLGPAAFEDPYHTWFGYAMVAVTVVLLWAIGFILPEATAPETAAETPADAPGPTPTPNRQQHT